jgi:DNA-binding MarR family transcriptional regulator
METILLSEKDALSIQELTERRVSLQPNITRMVVNLEEAGFVKRAKASSDRRVVRVQLTKAGYGLLDKIYGPLLELHSSQFSRFSAAEMDVFIQLLDKLSHPSDVQEPSA